MQNSKTSSDKILKLLTVRPRPGNPLEGVMQAGNRHIRCALGRSGMSPIKKEGDGHTPIGTFGLISSFGPKIPLNGDNRAALLPYTLVSEKNGWCDAVDDRNYNQAVHLPYAATHETLVRDDHLYDQVIILDFNIRQRMMRGGSAIFFHLAHPDYRPTEGCVAISRQSMRWLWPRIDANTRMKITHR